MGNKRTSSRTAPILRRVWVDRWHGSPTGPVHSRYNWFWLYGFVHPHSGEIYWWWLPWVNIGLFNRVLADVAQHFGVAPKRQMVMDQAGWHTSKRVVVPEGMHLGFYPLLPAYTTGRTTVADCQRRGCQQRPSV